MPKTTAIAATMKAEPTTESMRYLKAASSSSWPSPKATRAYEAMAATSRKM